MKNDGPLIVVAGVAFMVAVVLVGVFAPRPPAPEPEDPFRDLRFTSDRVLYTFGERVTFFLVNNGGHSFRIDFWTVHRFVDGEWVRVECKELLLEYVGINAGGTMTWGWTVASTDPALCEYRFATVEAGSYRGFMALTLSTDLQQHKQLFAEFVVM